ncbi:MAG: hypothetical protein HY921_05830 [Elusimicrobia bacterium]|nr:hypothetical protein [Elusimicrobiota bacterium]
MRILAFLFVSALSVAAHAAPIESLKAAGQAGFTAAVEALPGLRLLPSLPRTMDEEPPSPFPVLEDPRLQFLGSSGEVGEIVARINLAAQLDKHRDLITKPLGASEWDISVAGDAAFKSYFATFQQGRKLVIAPIKELKALIGSGIDITIEPGLSYKFKVVINLFDPIRGSLLRMTPLDGTEGPYNQVKTGAILDALKAKSFVFSHEDIEYWTLYGTDVDPQTNQLAQTRSFLFMHQEGRQSKAWPIAEAQLPAGQPVAVSFGEARFILVRGASEELEIRRPK